MFILSAGSKEEASELPGTLLSYDEMGVAEAQELRDFLGRTRAGERIIFFTSRITPEGQNALLKIFEEPPVGLALTFVYPLPETLLPTLRSRFVIESHQLVPLGVRDAELFAGSSAAKRMEIVKELIDREDRNAVNEFMNSLEAYLHNDLLGNAVALGVLLQARRRLASPDAPTRAILEYVALNI